MSWSRHRGVNQSPGGQASTPQVRVMWHPEESAAEVKAHIPAMDIYEKDDAVVIEIELPGMKREDINVFVAHNLVMVEALKEDVNICQEASGRKRITYLQLERKLGRFRREIELPITCNTREAKAAYDRGVLIMEFKKIKDRRGEKRKIPVE